MIKKIIKKHKIIISLSIIFLAFFFFIIISFITIFQNQSNQVNSLSCALNDSSNKYLKIDFSKYSNYHEENDLIYKIIFFSEDIEKKEEQLTKIKEINKIQLITDYDPQIYQKITNKCNLNDGILIDGEFAQTDGELILPSGGTITATAWYYPVSFSGGGWHPGIDLANNIGTPIHAPANGVVLKNINGDYSGYGNYQIILVKTNKGVYTLLFGHLSSFKLNIGSKFKQGDVIAYMGNTGNSTGPHTHIEVFKHNKSSDQVVNEIKKNGNVSFGLGYTSIGNCSNVCRLQPQNVFNVKYGHVYQYKK
jgi:murein DD-endopeptidase MepM/ murein hydrolase activator NlpD